MFYVVVKLPDFFRVIRHFLSRFPENFLESDVADSPDVPSSEIQSDKFTDFFVHTAQFWGNRLKIVNRLEKKSGSRTMAAALNGIQTSYC